MNENTMNHHYNTPKVAVTDNRGLTVREIQYHRHPDTPAVTDERITCHTFTARGQMHTSADPRLSQVQINNFMYLTTLSGRPLLTTGADNGTVLSLNDAAGRPHMEINATGVTRRWQYENAALAGRPLAVSEQEEGGDIRITERFVYAGNTEAEKGLNLAGSLVRCYDNAGLQQTDSVSLTGSPVFVTRRLLKDAENSDTEVDWSGENEAVWQSALVGTTYNTQSTMDATGTVLASTDAMGNIQRTVYDVAGLLKGSWLTLKNGTEQVIVKSLTYSAAGQKLREEHGNGVVTTYMYEPQTQRLTGIRTERPQNHQQGRKILQDLRYKYDPVGNVLKVSNDAEATRYWRNQKVVPENTYVYDSLYQLVSATGREMANVAQQGTNLPAPLIPLPSDNGAYTNYTRTYHYDTGGNLTRIHHHAPATGNTYTTTVRVSDHSNRAVLDTFTDNPAQVDALFTAGGHQMNMMPGQSLVWTPQGELRQVRITGTEGELYRYDTASQRVIKIRMQQVGKNTQTQQTLYLPGLELRTSVLEDLHTITVGEAGRAQVRVLRWEQGKPDAVNNNQVRYSYDNLTSSSGLEVDADGKIISMEEYYPYGGTAILTARSQTEAGYKTRRYTGKERDATGLYYYGYRYYQPWAGRWLSADPAGTVDGLNLYRMVRNNPVKYHDVQGFSPVNENESSIKWGPYNYKAVENAENILKEWDMNLLSSPMNFLSDNFKLMIHAIPIKSRFASYSEDIYGETHKKRMAYLDRLATSPKATLQEKDYLSASIITNENPVAYASVGFIMKVPKQNIILASDRDINFENNKGDRRYPELQHAIEGSTTYTNDAERNAAISKQVLRKDTPIVPMRNLFSKSPGSEFGEHNEIIFTPKPGVNIHPGMPATEDIDVIGAFRITPNEEPPMASALNTGYNLNILSLEEEASKFLDTFKINNSSLPVINIRGKGGWR